MAGKYFIAGLLTAAALVLIGAAGFYFGKQESLTTTQTSSVSDLYPSPTPSQSPSPSPEPEATTVTAGGAVSFATYTIKVPIDWNVKYEPDTVNDTDRLTLAKGSYEIRIFQGATGGAACLYPGDPPSEGPSGEYTSFTNLTTVGGMTLRRSGSSGGGFTICQLTQEGYFQPTNFGHIAIVAPVAPSPQIVSEIDAMLTSLTIE